MPTQQQTRRRNHPAAPPEMTPQRWKTLLVLGVPLLLVLIGGFSVGWWWRTRTNHADAGPTRFEPTRDPSPAPSPAPDGMVWIPGGSFWMGCEDPRMPDAQPIHAVAVYGFWMDATPVTNAQYAKFVEATHYLTVAERPMDPKQYPGVPVGKLVPGAAVFVPPTGPVALDDISQWWHYAAGASWNHPEGPDSNVKDRHDHPVVQLAFEDAEAYAKWAGKRLATEAEYEYAARGGLDRKKYAWGDDLKPAGKWPANIFQGHFPDRNLVEDGHAGSSPVRAFAPNNFGLYDIGGNVWEWCSDWYRADTYAKQGATGTLTRNPVGPADSDDPEDPGSKKRVTRGGSFLCSDQYCVRYLVGSRGKQAIDSGTANLGFRCVKPK